MARYLYLLRHAQSVERQPNERDHDRELTPRGAQEAMMLGAHLQKRGAMIDVILSSTAERAKATANLVGEMLKFDMEKIFLHEELFDASTRTFFQFLSQLSDDYQSVMCVGHNPAISYVAEYLTRAEIGDIFPTGLAVIQCNVQSWKELSQGTGELTDYIHPSILNNS
ncbi:MAG TPA: histidine phosphatase family protein [Ohtaekwangia sp.]|nr:histidine phosphatase family protein [Ohtaekwangia sp.]